jgi:hypothetical protein
MLLQRLHSSRTVPRARSRHEPVYRYLMLCFVIPLYKHFTRWIAGWVLQIWVRFGIWSFVGRAYLDGGFFGSDLGS